MCAGLNYHSRILFQLEVHYAYALGREKEAAFLTAQGADIALSNMYGLFPREGLRPRRFSDLPK